MAKKWKIITRFIFGECNEEERKKLEGWMQDDPALRRDINLLKRPMSMKQGKLKITDADIKWNEIRKDIEYINRREQYGYFSNTYKKIRVNSIRPLTIIRIAAIVFIIVAVTWYFTRKNIHYPWMKSEIKYKVVAVGLGEQLRLRISDGTCVFLDAGSEFRYPEYFNNRRDFYLKGEGYFEVSPDSKMPFSVHAKNALVEVVGTKFNIRAWDEKPEVAVTVTEGKVMLKNEDLKSSIHQIIGQGEQSKVEADGRITDPQKVDTGKFINWMHNEIHFDNVKVKEVLAQLERWYNFRFEINDTSVEDQYITIHINESNVNEALELVGIIANVQILRDGNIVRFIKKN